jgi:hypothetical protein
MKMDIQNRNQEIIRRSKQAEIRSRAEHLIVRTERLISLCDSWLPADEANKNIMKAFDDREKAKRRKSITNMFRFSRFLKFKKIISIILPQHGIR